MRGRGQQQQQQQQQEAQSQNMIFALPGTDHVPGVRMEQQRQSAYPQQQQQQPSRQLTGNRAVENRLAQRRQRFERQGSLAPAVTQVSIGEEQGPPPFTPRRPRQDLDELFFGGGDAAPPAETMSQGRFKRVGTASVNHESRQRPAPRVIDMATYARDSGLVPDTPMQGIISLEDAGMQTPHDTQEDPLGFAKRFGITPKELLDLDAEVRMSRFTPTRNMLERLTYIVNRLRNENHLSARGVATVLYRIGARAIWVAKNGNFVYGTQAAYLERMRAPTVEKALEAVADT
jgi:hypothetical protein